MESEDILAEELIKLRSNKVLIDYLHNTKQYIVLCPVTKQLEFYEEYKRTPAYIKSGGKTGWGCAALPTIPQHPAQNCDLSLLNK